MYETPINALIISIISSSYMHRAYIYPKPSDMSSLTSLHPLYIDFKILNLYRLFSSIERLVSVTMICVFDAKKGVYRVSTKFLQGVGVC